MPILVLFIWSHNQNLMSDTDHTALHYAVFSVLCQLLPFTPKYFPRPLPYSKTLSPYITPFSISKQTYSQHPNLRHLHSIIFPYKIRPKVTFILLINTDLYKAIGHFLLRLVLCCFRRNVMWHCENDEQ
jgi:hypothetical protein